MNTPPESRWDRNDRLRSAFPSWCRALAKALDARLEPKPADAENQGWQTLVLASGYRVALHLNGYDEKVSISGSWPKDSTGAVVTPRDTRLRYDTKPAQIYVGFNREPVAVAKDITRRFLPAFNEQFEACLECVAKRAEYADTTSKNLARLTAAVGAGTQRATGTREAKIYTDLPGIYSVTVSGDSAAFEARSLPVDQAEQLLRLLATFKTSAE